MPVFYVEYEDDAGEPASAWLRAPNEDVARLAIGPRKINHVVPMPDGAGPDELYEGTERDA